MKLRLGNARTVYLLTIGLVVTLLITSMFPLTPVLAREDTIHHVKRMGEVPLSASTNPTYEGSYPAGMVSNGYNPFTNTYYSYNTTSFLATVTINSVYAYNYSNLLQVNDVSFQLNAILEFDSSGITYSYWVQDVAELNTANQEIHFFDNIWNFSSISGMMYGSSVSGNGSVNDLLGLFSGDYVYEDYASYFAPGNHVSLNYPATVQLRVTSELSDTGYPEVVFQYNDGYGWVTYDNAYFFTNSLESDNGFLVNGYFNTGYGLPYNAGIVMGGYGNGAGTTLQNANMTMSLLYWNGHNYQAPVFAENNGADTAESVQGAGIEMTSSNGIPVAHLTTGSTSPGLLYSQYEVGQVSVLMPEAQGALSIAGNSMGNEGNIYEPYVDGNLTMTLVSGSYNFSSAGIIPSAYGQVNITGGSMTELMCQQFSTTGLPNGLNWSINLIPDSYGVESILRDLQNNFFAVLLPYGLWVAEISAPQFYVPSQGEIQFSTNGNTVNIAFQGVGYLVGEVLPQLALVYVNGSEIQIQNGSFNLSLPPGQYTVTANENGYSPFEQNVTVHFRSMIYDTIELNKVPNQSPNTVSLLEIILTSIVVASGVVALGLVTYWKWRKL